MDQEERQRKLEAGRAKLAHFRQRKAKGDCTNSQKKTPKRKSTAVHSNDLSAQEHPLVPKECSADSVPKRNNVSSAEMLMHALVQIQTETEQESILGDEAAAGVCEEQDDLRDALVTHTGKEPLQELQTAVEKRNEIISQLSVNLQVALESRDQVQLEAMQLTSQMQDLQQQLQQASEFLRARSQSSVELSQAQQHISQFQHSLQDQSSQLGRLQQELVESRQHIKEQQYLLTQKETEIKDLQQKQDVTETALSQLQEALSVRDQELATLRNHEHTRETHTQTQDALLESLRAELQAEREVCLRERERVSQLEQLVRDFEMERREMKDQLAGVREELSMEARHCKEEEEELSQEVVRLDSLVWELQKQLQEEETASRHQRAKLEADISNYELRLRSLEEEKAMDLAQVTEAHEVELKRLRQEHEDEVWRLQQHQQDHKYQTSPEDTCMGESLEGVKVQEEHVSLETVNESQEEPGLDLSFHQDHLIEKYLTSVAPRDSTWGESSQEQSLLDNSGNYRFELDGKVELEAPKSVCSAQDAPAAAGDLMDMSFPSGRGSEVAEPGEESLTSGQWHTHISASQVLESLETVDLGKALLIQQCSDLTAQLEDRDRQLEKLQGQIHSTVEEVREVSERWSKAEKALESVRWELEAEREQRLRCEEVISCKTHEGDNLKNKLSFLESQQEYQDKAGLPHSKPTDTLFHATADLIRDLREEKELLLGQLREQEQLVRDVQEKKLAGDSVTSDVQALFGRQLSALQTQRDGLQVQLESLEVKNQTTSKLLEQKTLELDSTQKELQHLRAELEESKDRMQKIGKEKMDLESRLLCLKQNLANAEEALCQGAEEKTVQEERLGQIETLVKNTENTLQTEREAFLKQLQDLEAVSLEKESALEVELESVRKALSEQGTQHSKAIEEAEAQLRQAHQEICRLQGKHQDEVCDLTLEMEKKLLDLETEQKKQIALIKQVHEREHQRELAELASRHRDNLEAAHQEHLLQAQTQQALELEALRLSLNNLHAAQLELSQSNLQRDKEAALSELQSTLRDKWAQESAMLQTRQQFELEKIREQCRQQHQRELDELKHTWESQISEERIKMEGQEASRIEDLKLDWQKEAVKAQSELQATLMETLQALSTTKTQLEELQASRDQEVKHLEEELSQAWTDRDAAAKAVEELVSSHNILLQDQRGHAQHLEELRVASTQREQQLQQQLEKLQGEFAALKQSSEQEVTHLRTQLDCTRASRQELGELKEQLLARSSRVEEIERLKQEFSQQRKDIQEHNELELENLRTYFEQRLRATEENYREEIALLQLRLVEGALEDSVLKTGDASFMSEGKAEEKSDILAEITLKLEKHKEEVGALRVELEGRHKQELEHLRSSMALAYREELLQVKTDLTDRYFSQIQDLKTRHSLELEQQKAKLSESHVKELTRLRGQSVEEASVRVEQEVERARVLSEVLQAQLAQRVQDLEAEKAELVREHDTELKRVREEHCTILKQAQEKLKQDCEAELCLKVEEAQREERTNVTLELNQQGQTEMATLREELQRAASGERASLLQQLEVERERLRTLQEGLETEQSPQILVVKQKIQAQFENELQEARNAMAMEVKELKAKMEEQTEAKLQDTQSRFLDEKKQHEAAFEKLKQQHCKELHEHEERYKKQLNGLKMDLHLKHTAALEALKVDLQGKQRAQLDALEAELRGKHRAEMDALEVDLRGKHRADLDALERDLQGKHKAELDALQVVLQETNLAQLEAQEAELQARHKQEREELEARMLSNMDTLETTYLAEIQAIRDEGERALQELRESCERAQQVAENGHAAELERLHAENHAQLLSITEELRRELAQVHMDKFTAMAAELKNAHQAELTVALTSQCDALEMEHSRALQNLRQELLVMDEKHSASLQEVREQYSAEMQQGQEQMAMLKTQHQQQLQELSESSARNLEEEVSRQRLQFQEEAEKLLQQRVTQLKEEFAAEKAATLEECEQKAQVCRESVDQLNKQLQEKHAESSQLRAEVSNLQGVLEGKRSEMETLEMLLQRRERENQEGENLLTMLRADLSTASQERRGLQKVLLEVLRSTITTEDLISRKISACMDNRRQTQGHSNELKHNRAQKGGGDGQEKGDESEDGDSVPDTSAWSALTDEGLELSQKLSESLFSGGELEPEVEEVVLGACTRLQTAVDKLLELVTESTKQLEQTHGVQAHLEEQFSQGKQDAAQLVLQHRQLVEQLDLEAGLKSQLELELHKAEGLMEGYVAEKAALEEMLQQKETQAEQLVGELERLRIQLQELSEEHTVLLRQRDAIAGNLGEPEKELLKEAERLAQEKLDVQRQAEKDRSGLSSRLKLLENELEEQENGRQEQEEKQRAQIEDLQQHIQALERQLKHHRQFMDEQAVEREHERDEFQHEIKKLEAQLRHPSKPCAGGDGRGHKIEDLVFQVETLQAAIKEKIEDYNTLLLAKEQYQRDLAEQNEEIDKMAGRIRELEQALLNSSEANRALGHLEQELHKARKTERELIQDKEALQQQQYSNRLQISALQSKLDETRHRFPENKVEQALKEQLEAVQQSLLSKEKEAEVLVEQLEQVQRELAVKAEEVVQLQLQLRLLTEQNSICVSQLQSEISSLKETVSALQRQEAGEVDDPASMLQFPMALLEEKNQEIDHLNDQIARLQQEMEISQDNKDVEEKQAEMEELRSQVEHLRSDQARLRQDKEEEVEQLHEVINKLQEELAQLGPNRHEVSDSQEHSPESHPFWSHHSQEESLCHELNSHSLKSSRTRLQELRSQLDQATSEKDALQSLLHTQEDTFRGQVEMLGRSLAEERQRLAQLEDEGSALQNTLSQREQELELLTAHVCELEDKVKKRDDQLLEVELQRDKALADLGKEVELQEEVIVLREEKGQMEQQTEELLALREEKARLEQQTVELLALREEKAQMEQQVEELQQSNEEISAAAETHKEAVITLEAEIRNLETVKQELFMERQALRQREGRLQEEIERLKQEVTSNRNHIHELNSQLEEKVAKHAEAQKEVLTCAEETLAKAEAALREKEEQLAHLRVEHEALRVELAAVKEGLSSSTERAEKLLEEGQTKDKALADLEIHNQRLKSELRGLQEDLALQEEEVAYQQRELADLREHYSLQECAYNSTHLPAPSSTLHKAEEDFLSLLSQDHSLSSPEVLRKLDCSEEPVVALHTSRLSELTLQNTSLELHIKASPTDRDCSQPPEILPTELDPPASCSPDSIVASGNISVLDSLDEAEKEKDFEQLDLTPSPSPACSTSTLSIQEWVSDGYGSNVSSELGTRLNVELATTERLDANFVEYLRNRGMSLADNSDSAADGEGPSHELLSPELQGLLKRVYQEGCRVLSLSHRPVSEAPPQSWQREKRALQETVLSLRDLLCKMADKQLKMDGGDSDWRRELLQAVRSVFDSERLSMRSELQSLIADQGLLDPAPLMSHLEILLKQQEEQQCRSLEQLLSADRRSLMEEIQNLQTQLRISSLQNQEQLQQLQGSLSAAQEESCQQQHQLRRQVELLEYRLQQEQICAEDLRSSLSAEQMRGSEQRTLLRAEQGTVDELRRELAESGLQLKTANRAQQELSQENLKLRMRLESEQAERQERDEAMQQERLLAQQLQEELEQERLCSQRRQEQDGQAHELLRASLDERSTQITELRGALEQERVVSSNLRMELQIEQSRCEALITQERNRASDALRQLEDQRSRCAQLTDSLTQAKQDHNRMLDEVISREKQRHDCKLDEVLSQEKQRYTRKLEEAITQEKTHYSCKLEEVLSQEKQVFARKLEDEVQRRDQRLIQELQEQLEQERRQGAEQAAMLERLQGLSTQAKRQLEEEAQQVSGVRLHAAMEGLHAQRQEVCRSLEAEKQRAALLQTELDALREKMHAVKEKERLHEEQRERQRKQEQAERERQHDKTSEKLQELQQQRLLDQQRMRQLQKTLADLEEQERQLTSQCRNPDSTLQNQQQHFAQQQLQLASVKIRNFLRGASIRRDGGLAQSEDSDLNDLLRTLTNLDQDLKHLCSQGPSPMSSSNLVERLLKENSNLTCQLTTLCEDKMTLKHTVSCLERELQAQRRTLATREQLKSPEPVDAALLTEKLAWQRERAALQTALRKAESELSRVTAEIENRPVSDSSSSKMHRLYAKYLRAESFRKALVYQKKYLLLLLGGFQDCEQATLSLIARMGAHPSPGDLQAAGPRPRPINRFRTAVRVVIAISRLRFLVRKWQRAVKKSPVVTAVVNGHGHSSGPSVRAEVLRPQHPGVILNSPPTRDASLSQRGVVSPLVAPIKSPFRLHNRMYSSPVLVPVEGSVTSSQDPERSLTEYIQHLEAVQQRLVGMQPAVHSSRVNLHEERRQSPLPRSADMMGYRQKWLRENRTWLYLSCLSPMFMNGLGSPPAISYSRKSDR